MLGRPARAPPISTRSEVFIAAAAFWHFPWSGKSRKVVFTATPPATEPAKTKVVTISVHIIRLKLAPSSKRHRSPRNSRFLPFAWAQRRPSAPKMTVTGIARDAARQDRNHNPNDSKGDNLKLAGRRHSVVLSETSLQQRNPQALCSPAWRDAAVMGQATRPVNFSGRTRTVLADGRQVGGYRKTLRVRRREVRAPTAPLLLTADTPSAEYPSLELL
jgi:hypothetical protein